MASAIHLHLSTWDADELSGDSGLLYNLSTIQCPPELDIGYRWKTELVIKSYWDLVIVIATKPSLTLLTHVI